MTTKAHDVNDVMEFVEQFAEGGKASKAMFYFLYKEILVNRINILEEDPSGNRGAIEHNEHIINSLNTKLMAELEKH